MNKSNEAPLTSSQRMIVGAIERDPDSAPAWNAVRVIRMRGPLRKDVLLAVVGSLVHRHDALRATIRDNTMRVDAPDAVQPSIETLDLTTSAEAQREARLWDIVVEQAAMPVALNYGPLFRATLARLAPDDHAMVLLAHGVICDGWSMSTLIEEIAESYQQRTRSARDDDRVASEPPSFVRFAVEQSRDRAADPQAADFDYWSSRISAAAPTLELPTDGPRSTPRRFKSEHIDLRLDSLLAGRLKIAAGRHGVSLFTLLCAGYGATLARLSGNTEVLMAVPAAAQLGEGLDRLVGQCVAHLPLQMNVDLQARSSDLLTATQHAVLDAYEHMSCGIEALIEPPDRNVDPGRLPARVKFNLDPSLGPALAKFEGMDCTMRTIQGAGEPFELSLNAEQDSLGILLTCRYHSNLYDAATVQRWLALYQQVLEGLEKRADWPLVELLNPIAIEREMLARFNPTAVEFDRTLRIEALLDAQVERSPDSVAIVAGGEQLTYGAWSRRADGVAAELRRRGVRAGDLVGLSCGRNPRMLIGLYGILKAGAGYVPLDPAFPAERLDYMCQDAALRLVLSDVSQADGWKPAEAEILVLDGLQEATDPVSIDGVHSEMPAYVIYTSGSTGKPKGVRVPHRSVINFLGSMAHEPGMCAEDRLVAVTTLSFDIAVLELLVPLSVGAQVILFGQDGGTDGAGLRALLETTGATVMQATPATWRLLIDAGWQGSDTFKALIGGEALPLDLAPLLLLRTGELWNMYGPTETTVWSSVHRVRSANAPIPIGKPVRNTQFHVLDATLRPLPIGAVGELWIAGAGVTLGYLNRPELSAERFVPDPNSDQIGAPMYKTGDLGRWRADGLLECLGRSDHQVKVRGFRIELGEIEVQLCTHPALARAVVIAREDQPGDVRLVAYLVAHQAIPDVSTLREHLASRVPDYMIPQHFVALSDIPLLPNGKINRFELPRPGTARPDLAVPYQAPTNSLEEACCEVFAEVLEIDQAGRLDNFFELGGNSLLAMRVLEGLARRTGQTLTAPTIFAHPDPAALALCLAPAAEEVPGARAGLRVRSGRSPDMAEPIAIIGMAGRFPGARTVEALWDNLLAGRDSITQFTLEQIDASVPAALRDDPNYVRARGVIDDVEMFDNTFFGVSAREAEIMDPQQRVFLEIAWECMERAGYAPDGTSQPVGVFAGVYVPAYLHHNVMAHPEVIERFGEFQVMVATDKDYVATRVAHKLNLKGPAIAVNTACSTSLVAIAQAVDSLRLGRCDMALAGAASVSSPPNSGYLYLEGAMLSKDGHTRTFDSSSSGTAFNDGAAAVLLKPLSAALEDGDQVFAVIRGAATNNDGGGKASFTAPSVQGQAAVISAALADAGVDARSIAYVEAHGTGTPLGDPVELEGLTRAFRRETRDVGFCRIGSIKSNVGHLVTAAGAAGVIKTALALHTERLPATIHFESPNPNIAFATSPFVVHTEQGGWPRGAQPRRAGVSSFGVGGTNAHAVLEEAPLREPSSAAKGPQLLLLSAKTRSALDTMVAQLATHLDEQPGVNLADVAHTLQSGRSRFMHRMCVVADSAIQAAHALRTVDDARRTLRAVGPALPALALLFPGQGAQYAGMGRGLYQHDAAFREAFNACQAALQAVLPFDLKSRIFGADADALTATATTQPATFCLEYALAQSWLARGVRPALLIGHSVGEFVAAVVSGVMNLADAARLVARRGALMQALPAGSMLSVRMDAARLLDRLPAELSLAAENGPNACVIAGPSVAVQAFQARLEADGVVARTLQTSHAFHSSMMDPAVAPFEAEVRSVSLRAPRIPIISTLTGKALTAAEAIDPHYWARHLREPVRFSPALRSALDTANVVFLEVGPRASLSTLARQHGRPGEAAVVAIASLGDQVDVECAQLAFAQGELWTLGLELKAAAASPAEGRQRVRLPTYPFERRRFWLEAAPAAPASPVPRAAAPTVSPQPTPPVPFAPVEVKPVPTPALPTTMSSSASNRPPASRRPQLIAQLQSLFEEVAGVDLAAADGGTSFVEMGLDSLTLTQAALQVKKQFGVALTFRQLMERYRSFDTLAEFLDVCLPQSAAAAPEAASRVALPTATAAVAPQTLAAAAMAMPIATPMQMSGPVQMAGAPLQQMIAQHMHLIAQQLTLLSAASMPMQMSATPVQSAALPSTPGPEPAAHPAASEAPIAAPVVEEAAHARYDVKKAFGAIARIHTQASDLSPRQRARLDAFVKRYTERTRKSKAYTVEHRPHMADPRVVNSFRPMTKEIIYQIVVERTKGSRMWDLDGNEYVDTLNGFGMNLLGWQPDFINDAVRRQLDLGYEIGPQHPLAGEVSKLMCELTGHDRAGLCNTGSEAVMAAMRIARTVTGRNTIVLFTGSYHGTFDEVLVRAGRGGKGISAAPGVMAGMFGDVRVLDYGTPESLEFIRRNADDLAAVLVEPVQSRRPDFQPREFLKEVRAITERSGTCFIFDEVITGFRSHLGGAQALFGIRADLACYGKVIGGGFPVGAVCGKREYMDALDGGAWDYGDGSMPTVGVTYFAGTFVRHPLALAAAKASLEHFKRQGPDLQTHLNVSTAALADELSAYCREVGAPLTIRYFASLWRVTWLEDHPLQDLLFAMMRSRGVHILDNFPCFMTTAHSPEDIARIKTAFKESVAELQEAEFLPRRVDTLPAPDASRPPVPGAKLGRDKDGRPAWFVHDANVPGKYTKVVV